MESQGACVQYMEGVYSTVGPHDIEGGKGGIGFVATLKLQ